MNTDSTGSDPETRSRRITSRSTSGSGPLRVDPGLLRQCWFLAGPTASGKSAAGLELAVRINAEIVAMDSMTIYRGLDIGTAKPSLAEQARVPHHLLDLRDPHEEYSVAEYLTDAANACRDILSRNRVPLFVGGTGLYLRSLLRGVFQGPPADWDFRGKLEAEAQAHGPLHLHQRLREVDPQTAARLPVADVRRIIRALEIAHLTGQPASIQQREQPLPESDRPRHVYWLSPPRDWLYERINRRVDAMIDAGLLDEVRRLLAAPGGMGRTARQALGYKELIAHFEEGVPIEEAIEQLKTRTRQFAKRQHTWYRNLQECHAVSITADESPTAIAMELAARSDS